MSDRTAGQSSSGKSLAQDVLGVFLCSVGGFFAVSLVLALLGWESRGGAWTWPVEELLTLLGPWAALLLSAGLACLGTLLFLQRQALATSRPLAALLGAALGLALLLGAFGGMSGGLVGSAFPSVLGGFGGALLAGCLGAVSFLLSLAFGWGAPRSARMKPVSGHRIELSARTEAASGVSAAEAALLVTEPPRRAAPKAPSAPVSKENPAPPATERKAAQSTRDETIRPYTPPSSPEATSRRIPAPPAVVARQRPDQDLAASRAAPAAPERQPAEGERRGRALASTPVPALEAGPAQSSLAPPPVPAWEDPSAPAGSTTLEEAEPGASVPWSAEPLAPEAAPSAKNPSASWEQIGLFDEEEEEDDIGETETEPHPSETELASTREADDELEDFEEEEEAEEAGDAEPDETESARGPELESSEDPFASAPVEELEVELVPVEAVQPAGRVVTNPEPRHAAVAGDPGSEGWSALVFDAGCLVVEQNRVAVSMLERRFGIDFDQACKVLDELQQSGLIGPYMGGRTRDILLSREEWLAHAPHAS